jgi:hypothetical protein
MKPFKVQGFSQAHRLIHKSLCREQFRLTSVNR